MYIYVTRHGQTDLNKDNLMQGLSDIELNETGIKQANLIKNALKDVKFDAIYSSPLKRAKKTAATIGNCDESSLIIDKRIIEVDFGKYEKRPYKKMGIKMTLYWLLPEIFKAPKTVEPISSMRQRTGSFLKEIEQKNYENVLIVCHGGIIRAISGYLEDRKNGVKWRPKPQNCEVRVYESKNGVHSFIKSIKADI